ncbi:MAG TPA: Asp-tRNA(Asn)/Glu-tRNA(Gln) amidotransferase subunit GatC [Candidatus Nanoarchaeia archaeon]|nr:glutamyl-tRNA(Gln) amidotransferase subunit C [uncultured archaeon]
MALTSEQVRMVAKLANLELTETEVEKFRSQLEEVIDYNAEKLSQVNTDKVEPLLNVSGLTNALRGDEPQPGLPQKSVLQNAKNKHNGFFKVKAILD